MNDNPDARPIVVGFDDSPQAHDALVLGTAIATATGDRLVLAGAYGPEHVVREEELDARRAQVLERLGEAADSLPSDLPLPIERRALPGSSAAAALQELAELEHPRALVLGSCHRGAIGRVLIGGVAESLLHGASCPVVIAPRGLAGGGPVRLRTVCVGFDGGPEGWTALQRGAQIAAAAGGCLRVAMVVPPLTAIPTVAVYPPEIVEQRLKAAERELDHALRSVAKRVEPAGRLLRGHPAEQLAEEAAAGVDLMVVGSRGYGPLQRVLLGSVSTSLMHSAPCPVMVVPRTAEFDPSEEGLAGEDQVAASA